MSTEDKRICRRCLIRDLAEEDQKDLLRYLDIIKEPDRADQALYESRLSVCLSCDKMNAATCNACGCYVEFRALPKHARCPLKKW